MNNICKLKKTGSLSGMILMLMVIFNLYNLHNVSAQILKEGITNNYIKTLGFIENKGQITDQNYKPNPGVKYLLSMPCLNIQLKANSFSYDAYIVDRKEKVKKEPKSILPAVDVEPEEINFRFHRIDIEFIGANASPQLIAEEAGSDYLNYYTAGTSEEGATFVNHYGKITYKDLYPGIDLVFYARPGTAKPVEYNFIVHPGADLSLIQWKYKGSDEIKLLEGTIKIQTTHGLLTESIPHSYEKETDKTIELGYQDLPGGIFAFEGKNDQKNTLVIDPIPNLKWSSYFGGSLADIGYCITTDASGNVFVTGYTVSTTGIATTGAYQTTFGGGTQDAFIVKFDPNGNRIWSTYFGGSLIDQGTSIKTDKTGNIYIGGSTTSTSGIASTGAFQTTSGGGYDAFVAKFNPTGTRLWGTYYGGTGTDNANYNCLGIDTNSNVYLSGVTNSTGTQMSTSGAYKTTMATSGDPNDAFLIKLNSSGARQWSTYFGGPLTEYGWGLAIDANANVFMTGNTVSTSGLATIGAYQTTFGGGTNDAILTKWSTSGSLLWATYYGGSGAEVGWNVATDAGGNVYITGYTLSTNAIATTGAYQTTWGGGTMDAFLAKFSSSGARLWATYYGGSLADFAYGLTTDKNGNIFFAGGTTASTGIATTGAYQTTFGGGSYDAIVAKFTSTGTLQWCTYYGGNGTESAVSIAMDPNGIFYLTGNTTSTSGLATTGAYQTAFAGGTGDVFVAKFQELVGQNNAGINRLTSPSALLCAGNQDIKVEIINAGFNTIDSLKVEWQIDGVPQDTVNITTPLLSGTSRSVTLGNVYFPIDTLKKIIVWTSMPNGVTDTVNTNDTVKVQRKPGLNGIYTIGLTMSNYATFSDAVNDLNTYGICGPVVFRIQPGNYYEKISLNQVSGTSKQNTITFIGAGKYSTVLSYAGTSATDMATVLLNGADQVTFRNMTIQNTGSTFGAGIWFTATADSNCIINAVVQVDSSSTSSNINAIVGSGSATIATTDGNTGSCNRFDSLDIIGGYHGIRINGPNTTTLYAIQNTINNSTFSGQYQYGIYFRNQSSLIVSHNTIKPLRFNTSYGLYLDYSANIEVNNNKINANDCGMYFNYLNRYLVNTGFTSRIYNNMVSSNTGYALYSNQSYRLKLLHNSFSADPAMSVVRFVGCLTIDLVNNHFLNRGNITARYALHTDNINTFTTFDYNNYYSGGSFVFVGTTDYGNLPVLQAAFSQFNQHSYSQDPLFYSNTDLHTSVNLAGIYVGIDQDIDEDFRNTTAPVLGADEVNVSDNAGISRLVSPVPAFCAGNQDVIVKIGNYGTNILNSITVSWQVNGVSQPDTVINATISLRGFLDVTLGSISFTSGESKSLKIWTSKPNGISDPLPKNDTLLIIVRTGLSGSYTIGGTKPDYTDFNQAVSALSLLGVCSPVIFEVRAGTYSEKVIIGNIKNASLTNTVTFKGSGKNSTNLSYTGSSSSDWATLMLKGTDFVTFRDMTISAMGTNYGIGILLSSQADSNHFVNLAIQTSTTSTSANLAGIAVISNPTNLYAAPGQPGDGNVFDSLEVNGGYYGLYLAGNSSYQAIKNSVFTEQATGGIDCNNQNYLKVYHNNISTTRTTAFSSINLTGVSNFEVHANTINTVAQFGIYIQNDNFTGRDTNFRSAIYNNMVSNTIGYSLYCENSESIGILHNSFRSVGNSPSIYAAVYFKSSGNIDLRNNQIRNDNPASYALYADMATFDSLDYNNYYSFGSFVLIGTPFSNLTALRNGLPLFNQNSYSQNPQYISLYNLHTNSFLQGIYVGINEDIDGDPRCPVNLSVGADDDPNWGFIKPVINTSHNNYFENYPVLLSNNVPNPPGKPVTYSWYINGTYYTDSTSIYYSFRVSGAYIIKFVAQNCAHSDSAILVINVVSGKPHIVLYGNNPDSTTVYRSYIDPGYSCINFLGQDITNQVNSGYNIDTNTLGSYYIWYQVTDLWGNYDSVSRTVVVVDDVAPVISLIGNDTITIEVFGNINDSGATVSDNYYSGLTYKVDSSMVNKNVVGIYKMIYSSTDSANNTGYIVRWVKVVDTGLPLITLIGGDTVKVDVFSQYYEAGAKVTDNYCTSGLQWQVDLYPPTDILASYTLTYTAADCYGNVAIPVKRVVKVVDRQKPSISLNGFDYVTTKRWQTYTDEGVSIDDNYYNEDTLQTLLNVTSNLDILYPGIYNVCYQVTDPSGNKSVKLCRTVEVKESTDGINSPGLKGQFHLYPNPNNGRFTVDFTNKLTEYALIEVVDITGKEVYRTTTPEQLTKLELDNLPTGIYQVRIQYRNEFAVLRVNIIK